MSDTLIVAFTIILSFVGIVISITALIFSIIYLIKAFKLEKCQSKIENDLKIIETIKNILINKCVGFPIDDSSMIAGKDVIKSIMDQYGCDEWSAILIYQEGNSNEPRT